MKLFTAIQTQWNDFKDTVVKYLSGMLGKDGNYGPSNIFGHIIAVLDGMMQNLMLYIEDAFTEQNVYTAQRKKSIYSLAKLCGYEPSLGTASKCNIKLIYNSKSGLESNIIVIPNRTTVTSLQNGLTYNIILPQDLLMFNINKCSTLKYIAAVEGMFESQEYTSTGGEMYTQNINFSGDVDLDYVTVTVNGKKWTRESGFYDMDPDGEQYFITVSMDKGFDVVFGNGQYGKILEEGDTINVEYLVHNGEDGNINPDDDITFTFTSSLQDPTGNEIDGNNIFNVELDNREGITSGTFSEDVEHVKNMIGYNSRSLVLADSKNYKIFLNRFSFVGYNRCWSENGSLVVNALVMKNYKQLCSEGSDYFNLSLEENNNDFILSDTQKESIIEAITESGQQIGGTILNFIDPELKKYAMFIYIRMKDGITYDKEVINASIKNYIGEFFGDVASDVYIPKSDIVNLLKTNISQIDGINIYILSEDNEEAKRNGSYIEKKYVYDPSTMTYHTIERTIEVATGEDPHLGLDEHGNILLENDMYFPIIRGGWKYGSSTEEVTIQDPVTIIYQN